MTEVNETYPLQPLRFRVWDSKNKRMIYKSGPECYELTLHGNAHYYRRQIDGKVDGDMFSSKGDGLIFSQWTGLKDAKGKEIYSGDILKNSSMWPIYIGVVVHFEGSYWVKSVETDLYATVTLNSEGASRLLVLGNIWENGDLLIAPAEAKKAFPE